MLKYALLDGRTPSNLDSYSFPYKLPGLETIDLAFDFFWVPALGFTQHDLTAVMQQFCHRDNAALLLSHGDDTLLKKCLWNDENKRFDTKHRACR